MLAISVAEAAALLSIGRVTLYKLLGAGELPSFVVGRRRLIAIADLRAFIEQRKANVANPKASAAFAGSKGRAARACR